MTSSHRLRLPVLLAASLLTMTVAAIVLLPVAAVTGFQARRLYAAYTTRVARLLLRLWRLRLRVHGRLPSGARQVVYVSNHSSTVDLFVLVGLGLPRTRFFLSGFLQKVIPLGVLAHLMGTFFTVPQDRPDERRRIFSRACAALARTGESVYLSPEGGRIATGDIGHFNKGAFHLAAALGAPIVPLYFLIPASIDPGMGYDVRPGEVQVFVKPEVDTRGWRPEDARMHADEIRARFVTWHEEAAAMRLGSIQGPGHAPVELINA